MHFHLLKLILWPKSGCAPRIVEFVPGVVNVISGASKTGKSAVIPIIDYCLGSKKCAIPVGVIREQCAWFGVLIDTVEGQKLLARREPEEQQSTGDMFVLEGPEIEVPFSITEKNHRDESVRELLNRLAGLTALGFDPDTDGGFKSRPSFRDLTAFMFQPQNIVANPDILFYKADTSEHREKLKTIFPYVLNAITPRTLALRYEVDQLNRKLRRLEADLRSLLEVSGRKISEGRTWLNQAKELGLAHHTKPTHAWPEIVAALKEITGEDSLTRTTTVSGMEDTLALLRDLREQETKLVAEASTHRQRLMELRRLREGSDDFASALHLQRERLSLSTWLRARLEQRQDADILVSQPNVQTLDELCNALSELEGQLSAHPLMSNTLDAEYLRQRELTEIVLSKLSTLRQEIRVYEANSELARQEVRRTASIERFLGALQQALITFEQSDAITEVAGEVTQVKEKIRALESEVHEGEIRRRMDSILNEIQQITGTIVPQLDGEWGDSPVRLNPKELTVQVSREGRTNYLWEIGSGANWLAYHVAITLALQIYFLRQTQHPVPALLIYDQPSQVYFPKLSPLRKQEPLDESVRLDQDDILAVRRIFKNLGEQAFVAKGRLQIIVLDHADEDVWGDLAGVVSGEEWRYGIKLVPIDWTQNLKLDEQDH